MAQFGAFQVDMSMQMLAFLKDQEIDKTLHVFDLFKGLAKPTEEDVGGRNYSLDELTALITGTQGTSVSAFRTALKEWPKHEIHMDPPGKNLKGSLSFAYVDMCLYAGTRAALEVCTKMVVPNGWIVVDNYGTAWSGVKAACDELSENDWEIFTEEGVGCLWARRHAAGRTSRAVPEAPADEAVAAPEADV